MSEKISYTTSHRKKALTLSIIPGLGQFYNKQFVKGAAFLIMSAAFFYVFKDLLNIGLWGLITLGEIPMEDHSVFLLVYGILAINCPRLWDWFLFV